MRVRVGCELQYQAAYSNPLLAIIRPQREGSYGRVIEETWSVEPGIDVREFTDGFGNTVWRIMTPVGRCTLRSDVIAEVPATPDPVLPGLAKHAIQDLPDETIIYTLPSRYCESDKLLDEAWRLFGHIHSGWEQVQAVCDYLHGSIPYGIGSTASTSAHEAHEAKTAVCRDFAHMSIAFCRALNIPARYVCGYLPDIGVPVDPVPMDFHAWFEAYLGGAWRTFDARHNRPRTGRVVIATGRDAVDTAFSTLYGDTRLVTMRVWADEAQATDTLNDAPLHESTS